MRDLKVTAIGVALVLVSAGCGFNERRWGACALGGGLIGAAAGAGTAGGLVNAYEGGGDKKGGGSALETGEAAGSGAIVGALLGTLLGHAICDPTEEAPPPPPPPPPPAAAAPVPKGTKLGTVGAANFDFNKATVKPEGRDVLDRVVKTLQDNPSTHIVVEGHTDSIGSDAYNQKLSERRARAVADYLEREGISPSRIRTEGYGKSRPVASNSTAEGRAQNRRAEIIAD